MKKRKILFVIPSLGGGGAERIVVLLLEYIDKQKYEPVLLAFESVTKYQIQGCDNLKIIGLNKRSKISNITLPFTLARVIRKEKPDVILSFMNYANLITSVAKLLSINSNYFIQSDHNNLTELMKMGRYGVVRSLITRLLYKIGDNRICVSMGVEKDLCDNWGVKQSKCLTIHNPVDYQNIQRSLIEPVNEPWFDEDIPVIIACGRLSAQKNYPMLLNAFSLLVDNIEVRLVILGEGEKQGEIVGLIEEYGIENRVKLMGFVSNPFKYIAKSTVFVLTSDSEGFGNVLIEAMACGAPVVSTRCPSGPEEIIDHMEDGILISVGAEEECANAMKMVLYDKKLRSQFSKNGREKSKRFDIVKVVKQYEAVFDSNKTSV